MIIALPVFFAMVTVGCGEHRRFGKDPSIVYPTDHTKQPILSAGRYGGDLGETLESDPKTFNVWLSDDIVSGAVLGLMFDSLEARDPFTLKFVPRLAYLPKISNDGLIYTYTLRPGLKWSDGTPLTADDVIFTLDVLFDPSTLGLYRESMLVDVNQPDGTVKSVPFKYEKIDDRTIRFILPVKWSPAQEMFIFPIAPKHALEKAYRAGRFNTTWGIDTPPRQIICNGPFLMTSYDPGERIEMSRNPYFWRYSNRQHLAYLDKFTDFIMPDANGQVLNFRSGVTDALSVPAMQFPVISEYASRDNYTVINEGPSPRFEYLDFNRNPGSAVDKGLVAIFSDVRFRKACSYAINRQSLCDDILIGLAHPACSPVTPAIPQFFDPSVKPVPYNPAMAKKLLLDMGMTPGADGMLRYHGKKVSFDILTNVQDPSITDITTVVANDLQQIGLDAQEDPISRNSLITKITAPPYDWQAYVLGWTPGPDPNDDATLWRSSGLEHDWWPNERKPSTPWEAEIDRDFTNGAHEMDPLKRRRYYDDWQRIVSDEQALVFLDYRDLYTAVRNHYGNVHGDVLENTEEIYDTRQKPAAR